MSEMNQSQHNQAPEPKPRRRSDSTLDSLYDEIYYSRKIKRLMDAAGGEPEAISSCHKEVRKRVKKRLRFRIIYNSVFLVALVFIVVSLSRAFIISNIVVENRSVELHVYDSDIPAYISASFNNAQFEKYSNEDLFFSKTIVPGDIINLSIFAHLEGKPGITKVEIMVEPLSNWLSYVKNSVSLSYADVLNSASPGNDPYFELNKTPGASVISPPAFSDGTLTFQADIPNDYTDYDGLCLDLMIYFEETFELQNEYINKTVKLRFKVSDISQ